MTASLGSISSSTASFTTPQRAASQISASLLSSTVWSDQNTVSAVIQVWDSSLSSQVASGTSASFVVVPNSNLATAPLSAGNVTAQCTVSSTSGTCVATATVPTAWFSDAYVSADQSVSVFYGFTDLRVPQQSLGSVLLRFKLTFGITATTGRTHKDVQMLLPLRDVLPGQSISIPVWGDTTYSVQSYTMVFTVASSLSITQVSFDSTVWTASPAISGQTASISANLVNEAGAATGEQNKHADTNRHFGADRRVRGRRW